MKKIILPLFLFFSFLTFTFGQKESNSIKIVDELLEAMEQACNDKDMKKVAEFYGDDSKLLAPGRYKVEGREAVNQYWLKLKPISWELTVAKASENENDLYETDYWKNLKNKPPHWKEHDIVIGKEEDVVYQLGHSKLTYINRSGKEHTSDVDFVLVWKKNKEGEYKVFIDTYASN